MTRGDVLLVLGAVAAGFVCGFLWGAGTRSALSDATTTSYESGELLVRVNVAQALREGAQSLFSGR